MCIYISGLPWDGNSHINPMGMGWELKFHSHDNLDIYVQSTPVISKSKGPGYSFDVTMFSL